MPIRQKIVVPKIDMETPSLANIEYFEWKRQIENAKGNPAKLREIKEQIAAYLNKQHGAVLLQCEQLLLPQLDKYELAAYRSKQHDAMLLQCEQLLLPQLDKYEIPY